jgi:hypothetical protein
MDLAVYWQLLLQLTHAGATIYASTASHLAFSQSVSELASPNSLAI